MSNKKEILEKLIILNEGEGARPKISKFKRYILNQKNSIKVKVLKPKIIAIFLIYLSLILVFMILPILVALIFSEI
jgi:hypothetical protein